MNRTQIILAIVLALAIASLFLPWVGISATILDVPLPLATNYGYNYIVPLSAPFAAPVGILCVIGFILSACSFKARNRIRELNIIAGVLIVAGAIAAYAFTFVTTRPAASAGLPMSVSGAYGMGLEILFGVLMIVFGDIALARRQLKNLRFSVLPVPGRVIAILFFVALFALPLFTVQFTYKSDWYLAILTTANIFVIFSVSWDLLSGYTGLINFGHALFFGVGAYSVALLHEYAGLQPWATIPIGSLVATVVGVVTSIPALRLRGPYLSLLTMAFPVILLGLVVSFGDITGAEEGISGIPFIAATYAGRYYICLIAMTVSVLIMWKLTDAGSKYVRTGLIFHAIREDEIAARALGINTVRYKILAFAIGGFFAGLAGTLYAHVTGSVGVSVLLMTLSFQAIIYVIFGGIVSIYGAVAGVYTLYTLIQLTGGGGTTFIGKHQVIIMAVLVILILLFMPEGIAVWIRDKIERQCPRCKLTNVAWRKECRACSAPLR